MLFPITRIAGPLRGVPPAFSCIQDDRERMVAAGRRGSRTIAVVAMSAMFGMMAIAPDFVPVVLGERWREAIPVLQILAIVGLLQALQVVGGSTLNAVGLMGTMLAFTIASYAANVAAFVAGLQWGINGVAVAYAIAMAALSRSHLAGGALHEVLGVGLRAPLGVLQPRCSCSRPWWRCGPLGRAGRAAGGAPRDPRLRPGRGLRGRLHLARARVDAGVREIRRRRGGGHRGPGAPAAAGAKR